MTSDFAFDLSNCSNLEHLSQAMGVGASLLTRLADASSFDVNYLERRIPKKNLRRSGEFRIVVASRDEAIRSAHRTIARRLALHASYKQPHFPAACVFGFVGNKSIKDNARQHLAAPWIARVDLQDFFPSIDRDRARDALLWTNLHPTIAGLLAAVYCPRGFLEQGLSGSPLISNLVCHNLDNKLAALATATGCKYSRYADDLTFSGSDLPPKQKIQSLIESERFRLAHAKYRVTKLGQSHYVTGLSVSDANAPHVPRRMKRRLRQEIHYSLRYGLLSHLGRTGEPVQFGFRRIEGMVRFIRHIEPSASYDFSIDWNQIATTTEDSPPPIEARRAKASHVTLAVDESYVEVGRHRMMLGCASIYDAARIKLAAASTLDSYFANPFSPGNRAAIAKEGLHFSQSHEALRESFIRVLPTLPFDMFVLIEDVGESKQDTYLSLLQRMAHQQYARFPGAKVNWLLERNPHVSESRCRNALDEVYSTMKQAGFKCPTSLPSVDFVAKLTAEVSVADFMLGALRSFLSQDARRATAQLQFEQLRDQFAHIYDSDGRLTFSRRNPLRLADVSNIAGYT